jgi:hypothetical protein
MQQLTGADCDNCTSTLTLSDSAEQLRWFVLPHEISAA